MTRDRLLYVLAAALVVGCGERSPEAPSSPTSGAGPKLVLRIAGVSGPVTVAQRYQLSAALYTNTGSYVSTPALVWSSTNIGVALVTPSGALVPFEAGTATITATATADVISAAVVVTVLPTAGAILPDGEFGDTLQLAPSETAQLTSIEYAATDRLTLSINEGAWSSSDSTIARVSPTGVVTGIAPGVVTITANVSQPPATRTVRVAPTSGSATIRLISVIDSIPSVTMRPNVGAPARLSYGDVATQTVPAGTMQLSFDGIPPLMTHYNEGLFGMQEFVGYLTAATRQTFVAIHNVSDLTYAGPLAIAPLADWVAPVAPDSSMVRLVAGTAVGYDVYFTAPGAPLSPNALTGCFSDQPFYATPYYGRTAGDFDIVFMPGECGYDEYDLEVARFRVTAPAGHAMTFIVTGSDTAGFKVFSVADP